VKLSVQQELALKSPYSERSAVERTESGKGVSPHHLSGRWVSSDVNVHIIFTVSIPEVGRPFWHVSMSVQVRNVGVMPSRALEKGMRQQLREVGHDVLKGVGCPPDGDHWDIADKALHLMRSLTDEEIAEMKRLA
jgi:hypothetical protein